MFWEHFYHWFHFTLTMTKMYQIVWSNKVMKWILIYLLHVLNVEITNISNFKSDKFSLSLSLSLSHSLSVGIEPYLSYIWYKTYYYFRHWLSFENFVACENHFIKPICYVLSLFCSLPSSYRTYDILYM